jgi:adenylylsulfate kinase
MDLLAPEAGRDGSAAVLVTGPLGSGKTSVATEVAAVLEQQGVRNAVVDLDWLCWVGPGIAEERLAAVLHDNVRAVVSRFRVEGIERFVLAHAVQSTSEVALLRDAVAPAHLTVVRLEVSAEVAAERVRMRAPADSLVTAHDLSEQEALWDAATLLEADLVVRNDDDRPLSAVATEVLAELAAMAPAQWATPSGV